MMEGLLGGDEVDGVLAVGVVGGGIEACIIQGGVMVYIHGDGMGGMPV